MNGQKLPDKHRCVMLAGDTGPSPALSWTAGPATTKSYAVTLTDKGNGYAHWTIYDIPAATTMLPEGVPEGLAPAMPMGAKQAQNENSFVGGPGYFGPCAGLGTYQFKVYALDVDKLTVSGDAATAVRAQIDMHSVANATLDIMSGM
jgi:Raf kinase inhibitor-like YbhB/YbcL family protein